MDITFTNPVYLWFLASVPFLIVLHLISMRFTKRKAILFANFEAIKRVETGFMSGGLLTKNIIFLVLRCFTLLFLVFSLAGTILWYQGHGANADFVIAIDASGSMLADDFQPNRLEAAKVSAAQFLDSIPGSSKVAVLSFSGTTFVKQRMTDDLDKARQAIKAMQIEFASGTAIGDAIISSSNLFEDDGNARVVVLVTDGQSNVGTLPEEALSYATKNHLTLYTVGVATAEGGSYSDIELVSKLDEETLQSLAERTGGTYFRARSSDDLTSAFAAVVDTTTKKIPIRLAIPLTVMALLLLFVEWLMINTRYRTIP